MFSAEERARLVDTLIGQYRSLTRDEVKERFLWYWEQIDADTAARIRAAVTPVAASK